MLLAVALFIAALMLRSWGAALVALSAASSLAFVWGIRHEEDAAVGGRNGKSSGTTSRVRGSSWYEGGNGDS